MPPDIVFNASIGFAPSKSELVFYIPKIERAVGDQHGLFPMKTTGIEFLGRAKIDVRNDFVVPQYRVKGNQSLQKQLEDHADAMLRPGPGQHRTDAQAQQILKGFVQWLDNSKFNYVSAGNFGAIADNAVAKGMMKQSQVNEFAHNFGSMHSDSARLDKCPLSGAQWNVFANVSSPIGNCLNCAQAFALLLFMNGFRREDLMLKEIKGRDGGAIMFKGTNNIRFKEFIDTSKSLTALYRLSGTNGGNIQAQQVTLESGDQPFDNHWIVEWNGKCYDPLYRCSYDNPDSTFDRIGKKGFNTKSISYKVPAIGDWSQGDYFVKTTPPHPEEHILAFSSPQVSTALKIAKTNGDYFIAGELKVGEGHVLLSSEPKTLIPLGLGRVFGLCVPDDVEKAKLFLMSGVMEYERSLSGFKSFYRCASDKSIEFVKKARAFCNKMDNVPTKIFDQTKEKGGWKPYTTWTEQNARKCIYDAMYVSKDVGDTLRKCLWNAFEVPNYCRK